LTDFIHSYAPHTEQALYGLTLISAMIFAVLGSLIAIGRGKGFHLANTFTQAGSGATFPTFLLMPLVPFDEHLMAAMAQSWVMVGLAGLLGAGVTLSGLWMLPMGQEKRRNGYLGG
jgi:hypothetical protein